MARCSKYCIKRSLKNHGLLLANMVAILLGLALGFGLRPVVPLSTDAMVWIGLWGELFINMIKMLILPLIVVSLILGVSSLEAKASGRLGLTALFYILITQFIGCVIGVAMGLIVKPGGRLAKHEHFDISNKQSNYGDVFADLLRNMFPSNLVVAAFKQAQSVRDVEILNSTYDEALNATYNITKETTHLHMVNGMNTAGIVTFSILFGVGTVVVGKSARPFIQLLQGVNDVIFWLFTLVTWYSPIGILSLIAVAILKIENMSQAITSLGWLVFCTFFGCLFHVFVIIHLAYFIIVRKNPYKYNLEILDGILAAFAPPTSGASLPYLFKDCEGPLKLDKRVTKFFIPIAVMLNRDGSVLFICASALFCAQTYGVELNPATIIALIFIVTALSVAIAMVPSGSVMLLLMLTYLIKVPVAERVGLLMAAEWLNDRIRTATNVVSHGFGCAIVNHLVKNHLSRKDEKSSHDEAGSSSTDSDSPATQETSLLTNGTKVA